MVALGHLARDVVDTRSILGLDGCNGFVPLGSSIEAFTLFVRPVIAIADLAAADDDAAAVEHLAVLAATPHGSHDEGRAADTHLGGVDVAETGVVGRGGRFVDSMGVGVDSHTGTEDIADIHAQGGVLVAYLATADFHQAAAGTTGTADGFADHDVVRGIGRCSHGEGAHGGQLATAEDGVVHIAAADSHMGVAFDIGIGGIKDGAGAATKDEALVTGEVVASHMATTDGHVGVAVDGAQLATAVDVVVHGAGAHHHGGVTVHASHIQATVV